MMGSHYVQVIFVTLVMEGLSLFYCIVSGVQCLPVSHEWCTRCLNPRITRNGILDAGAVRVGILYLVCFFRLLSCIHVLFVVKLLVILSPFPYFILVALAGRSNNLYTRS